MPFNNVDYAITTITEIVYEPDIEVIPVSINFGNVTAGPSNPAKLPAYQIMDSKNDDV